jgi:dermatan 4-sulfotransferase 1
MSILPHLLQWLPRRAARQQHVILVHPWRLAFFRVPKAANTSIKEALATALKLPRIERVRVSQDRYWRIVAPEKVEMITPRQFSVGYHCAGYWPFAVVREPVARVVSCYKSKIVKPRRLPPAFAKRGFHQDMTVDAFVRRVYELSDSKADDHLRSQSSVLTWKGSVLPELVVPMEDLSVRWPEVCERVKRLAGVELSKLARRNSTGNMSIKVSPSSASIELIRQRYAEDYRLFYPEGAGR